MTIEELDQEINENKIEMSITDMVSYLVEKVDNVYALLKDKREVVEEEVDSLDGIVYIKKGDTIVPLVKVGTVNEWGIVEFFPIETNAPIVPSLYKPEFYYVCIDSSEPLSDEALSKRWLPSCIPTAKYKAFTPRNIINQNYNY
jgi:hypothetical protein